MRFLTILLSAFIYFLNPNDSFHQNRNIYKHPSLDFQFAASVNWISIWQGTNEIYEMMSPDSVLHVKLWYTETEQDAEKYLVKMSDMKGLDIKDNTPEYIDIDHKNSWIIRTSGLISNIPVSTWLAVIPNGKVLMRPKENCLFIIQIWCAEKNYLIQRNTFENILNSVEVK